MKVECEKLFTPIKITLDRVEEAQALLTALDYMCKSNTLMSNIIACLRRDLIELGVTTVPSAGSSWSFTK